MVNAIRLCTICCGGCQVDFACLQGLSRFLLLCACIPDNGHEICAIALCMRAKHCSGNGDSVRDRQIPAEVVASRTSRHKLTLNGILSLMITFLLHSCTCLQGIAELLVYPAAPVCCIYGFCWHVHVHQGHQYGWLQACVCS